MEFTVLSTKRDGFDQASSIATPSPFSRGSHGSANCCLSTVTGETCSLGTLLLAPPELGHSVRIVSRRLWCLLVGGDNLHDRAMHQRQVVGDRFHDARRCTRLSLAVPAVAVAASFVGIRSELVECSHRRNRRFRCVIGDRLRSCCSRRHRCTRSGDRRRRLRDFGRRSSLAHAAEHFTIKFACRQRWYNTKLSHVVNAISLLFKNTTRQKEQNVNRCVFWPRLSAVGINENY